MTRAFVLSWTAWLLVMASAVAAPPLAHIEGPTDPVPVGKMVKLSSAGSEGASFSWLVLTPGTDGGPVAGKRCYWFVAVPGQYQVLLLVSNAEGTDVAQVTVTIGAAPPVPGPNPLPPPGPAPTPTDPLWPKLAQAWQQESDPDRLGQAHALAGVYSAGAALDSKDTAMKTAGDLFGALKARSVKALEPTALPRVRRALGDDLNQHVPTDPAAELTPLVRVQCGQQFQRMADLLLTLKERP